MSNKLSAQEQLEFKACFRHFAKQGRVKNKDMNAVLRAAGFGPTVFELKEMVGEMDDEGTGFVREGPFLAVVEKKIHPILSKPPLRAVYDKISTGQKRKKKKSSFLIGYQKPQDLSYLSERDWAVLIERLGLTHLFTDWQRDETKEKRKNALHLNEEARKQIKNLLREFDEEIGGNMEFEEFCEMMKF